MLAPLSLYSELKREIERNEYGMGRLARARVLYERVEEGSPVEFVIERIFFI